MTYEIWRLPMGDAALLADLTDSERLALTLTGGLVATIQTDDPAAANAWFCAWGQCEHPDTRVERTTAADLQARAEKMLAAVVGTLDIHTEALA